MLPLSIQRILGNSWFICVCVRAWIFYPTTAPSLSFFLLQMLTCAAVCSSPYWDIWIPLNVCKTILQQKQFWWQKGITKGHISIGDSPPVPGIFLSICLQCFSPLAPVICLQASNDKGIDTIQRSSKKRTNEGQWWRGGVGGSKEKSILLIHTTHNNFQCCVNIIFPIFFTWLLALLHVAWIKE